VPLGILLGILFQWSGLFLANDILDDMQESFRRDISIPFVVSWAAILLSAALSSLTVLYSAWRPARKAAKIPAIDAIRGVGEVKVKAKQVRTNPIVKMLFGVEGVLAAKSLKRSRRNFRTTVISLAVSMVLFIGAGAFGMQMQNLTQQDWMRGVSANVTVSNWASRIDNSLPDHEAEWGSLSFAQALDLTGRFKQHGGVVMIAEAGESFRVKVSPEERTPAASPLLDENFVPIETRDRPGFRWVSFATLDDETYAQVSELAGVPMGSNILVNFERQWSDDHRREIRVEPYVFSGQTWELLRENFDEETEYWNLEPVGSIELHGVLSLEQTLPEIASRVGDSMVIVPPDSNLFLQNNRHNGGFGFWWYVTAENSGEFEAIAYELIEPFQDGEHGSLGVMNVQAARDQEAAIVRVIMTAAYLFIAMLTLIGLTNVISTISTNVRTRAKEFATLESIGMTKSGITRMLRLESLLCSLRAICFGIPLGLLLSYVTHRIVAGENTWRFDVPWMIVLQCTIAVFVLTWSAMQVASRKLRSCSIVEAVRNETA
jgi:putative ABC transport system permease protein